jgi:hypothetical protein
MFQSQSDSIKSGGFPRPHYWSAPQPIGILPTWLFYIRCRESSQALPRLPVNRSQRALDRVTLAPCANRREE